MLYTSDVISNMWYILVMSLVMVLYSSDVINIGVLTLDMSLSLQIGVLVLCVCVCSISMPIYEFCIWEELRCLGPCLLTLWENPRIAMLIIPPTAMLQNTYIVQWYLVMEDASTWANFLERFFKRLLKCHCRHRICNVYIG